MRDAVASINNSAGERSLLDHLGGPGGSEGEHRLHRDVQTLNVEGLKHDLSGELPIFRRVHGWLGQQEVVVRWLSAHVLVDAALPVGFHIVPVLDDAMPDWVVDGVLVGALDRLIPNVKVKILHPFPLLRARLFFLGPNDRRDYE